MLNVIIGHDWMTSTFELPFAVSCMVFKVMTDFHVEVPVVAYSCQIVTGTVERE